MMPEVFELEKSEVYLDEPILFPLFYPRLGPARAKTNLTRKPCILTILQHSETRIEN